MTPRTTFSTPWDRAVRWATPLTIALIAGAVTILINVGQESRRVPPAILWAIAAFLTFLLAATVLFAVRGYRIEAGTLAILRPGWTLRVSLQDLRSLEADPESMKGVWAKAGGAGFMGYFGWFWSSRLGVFHAWVTDSSRCVRLTFPTRIIVVSPDDPLEFVAAVKHQKGWTRSNAALHPHGG